ncbi:SDR family oxidoreductase [Fodinicurvata sp. EGI_FJ10296]|uniref:SDR family NAD(P)-dependent oxidoreductase n=1 Tax=Fodinicurvata sp. EGI_FJ10296 TaxID=3231908 RepID=UPI003454C4B9
METTEPFSLAGRTALVVGGTSGLGREIALGMKKAGARVVLVGRDTGKIDAAVNDLGGEPARGYAADVTDVSALRALAGKIESDVGPVHILVNSQGTTEIKPALEFTEEEYDRVVDTNLKSVFFTCQAFGARMVERGDGCVINIASLAAHYGWANATPYSISKYGVHSLTNSLAAEWGGSGVRVNAISPGFFLTDLNKARMSEERKAQATARNAMHRFGDLPEIAGAAVFLASPAAKFITGETIRVDGGYLATGI